MWQSDAEHYVVIISGIPVENRVDPINIDIFVGKRKAILFRVKIWLINTTVQVFLDFTNELLPDEFAPVKIVIGFKLNVEPFASKTLKFLML